MVWNVVDRVLDPEGTDLDWHHFDDDHRGIEGAIVAEA